MRKFTYLGILVCLVLSVFSCKEMEEHLMPPEAKEATDVQSKSFSAQWCTSHGATGYLLYVSEHNDFSSCLAELEGKYVEGTSYDVEYLEPDTKYYYYVKAVMGDMTSEASNHIEVKTLKKHQLPAPMLYEAEDVYACSFKLKWNLVTHAEAYILDVAYDEQFNNYVDGYEHKELYELHHVMADMHENKDYYCRVKAVNGDKKSTWSNVVHVKTPEKVCAVMALKLYDEQINPEGYPEPFTYEHNYVLSYDSYSNPSCLNWDSEGFNDNIKYKHDTDGNLMEWTDGRYHYSVDYENGNKKIYKKENGSLVDVQTVTYEEGTGKYWEEYVQVYHEGTQQERSVNVKKVYYEDHLGNIVKIIVYHDGYVLCRNTFKYDGYRNPKHFQYLAHSNIYKKEYHFYNSKVCMPEQHFPVWHEQPCNVSEYKCEYMLGDTWVEEEKMSFEYEYNENRFPIYRRGGGNSEILGHICEMYYDYKSCK